MSAPFQETERSVAISLFLYRNNHDMREEQRRKLQKRILTVLMSKAA